MKLRKLLAMSMVVATGLTLASCGGNKVYTGIGYDGSWELGETGKTGQLDLTAAFAAIFNAKADFPIAGLAANNINSDPCNPAVL